MKKGSKKKTPQIYKGPDYEVDENGIERVIPESKKYYSVQELTAEAKKILDEYGFKLSNLFSLSLDAEMSSLLDFCDKSTLHRYFSNGKDSLTMPDDIIQKIPIYMENLGNQLENPGEYLSRVFALAKKIERYCFETKLYTEKMTAYLKEQDNKKLLQFLKSIYALQLSEETWCFWLCYSILNVAKQREAKSVLSGCTGLIPNYDTLFSLFFYNRKDDLAFQHLILKAEEKYYADGKKLQKELIEIALTHFQSLSDKKAVSKRVQDIMNFDITLSPADWSVLFTYEYLCDKREISKAGNFVLSAISDKKNLQERYTTDRVKCYERRFRSQIEEREEIELEQFLLSVEEIE